MGTYGSIDFDDEEIEAASHWYGGQGSMLYAITSTGALSRGTIRPRHDEGRPMTDEEWIVDLAERLEGEAEQAARDASKQAKKAKGAEREELRKDAEGLRSIAFKARAYIRDAESARKKHGEKWLTTRHLTSHARKKSPAQLDREIAQALGSPSRQHATTKGKSAVADALGYEPDAGTVDRAEAAYSAYSTNELRRELQSLEDQFEMSGGRGVGLADRLDAARIALALRGKKPGTPKVRSQRRSYATRQQGQSGRRIDRKKLGEMMSPWGSDFSYGQGSGAIGAVSSYYYSDKKYPDRGWVARALEAIEEDIPRAEHGAHGWTKKDARDLRKIAAGLRYYLHYDYKD